MVWEPSLQGDSWQNCMELALPMNVWRLDVLHYVWRLVKGKMMCHVSVHVINILNQSLIFSTCQVLEKRAHPTEDAVTNGQRSIILALVRLSHQVKPAKFSNQSDSFLQLPMPLQFYSRLLWMHLHLTKVSLNIIHSHSDAVVVRQLNQIGKKANTCCQHFAACQVPLDRTRRMNCCFQQIWYWWQIAVFIYSGNIQLASMWLRVLASFMICIVLQSFWIYPHKLQKLVCTHLCINHIEHEQSSNLCRHFSNLLENWACLNWQIGSSLPSFSHWWNENNKTILRVLSKVGTQEKAYSHNMGI